MTKFRIFVAVFCIIFLLSSVSATFANADWMMFHADPSHSGLVTGNSTLSSTPLWKYATDGVVESSAAVVSGVLYVGSFDNNIYALNATNGNKLWNYTTGGAVFSSPAVVNGVVYIGSFDNNIYALNATNGNKLWNYTTGGNVESSPAVVTA